jgi:hypothetical protein
MKQLSNELGWKYINYATELRKIKDGRYGHNLWFFALRTYLAVSLWLRLIRLNKDFKQGKITLAQYLNWKEIIHLAI